VWTKRIGEPAVGGVVQAGAARRLAVGIGVGDK